MLATATVIAQEYHGEMERLYPDKTKTTKKTTKKNTPTEKKTDTDEKKTTPKAASEPTTTLLPDLQQLANELLKGRKGSIVAIRLLPLHTPRGLPLKQHKHSLSYRKVH